MRLKQRSDLTFINIKKHHEILMTEYKSISELKKAQYKRTYKLTITYYRQNKNMFSGRFDLKYQPIDLVKSSIDQYLKTNIPFSMNNIF